MNKWIPVSERLPEEETQYLCVRKTCRTPYYEICRYVKDLYKVDEYDFIHKKDTNGFYIYDSEYGYLSADDVIAWMPITEYEGEAE